MPDITGTITMTPADGATYAAGTSVDVTAQGDIIVPAAQGGVQDQYRVTVYLTVYNNTACTTSAPVSISQIFTEVFEPKNYTIGPTSVIVSANAHYRATAELFYEKKKVDGTWDSPVLIARATSLFRIGTPADCAPRADFCDGLNSPVAGCIAPIPAPGSQIPAGNVTIGHRVRVSVVGAAACTKEYHFVAKLKTSNGAEFEHFMDLGLGVGWFDFVDLTELLGPGVYTVTTTVTAQRIDKTIPPNPACHEEKWLGSYSWQFAVLGSSTSSSSSSSSQSSSSLSSSSSSSSSRSSSSSASHA